MDRRNDGIGLGKAMKIKLVILTAFFIAISLEARTQNRLPKNLNDQRALAADNIKQLRERLGEYSAGKRSDRDGYIILRLLLNNYQILGDGSKISSIESQLKKLEYSHPEFKEITNSRLSDEIDSLKKETSEQSQATRKAAKWTPKDSSPLTFMGAGKDLVVRYQFRIDFYTLADGVNFDRTTQSLSRRLLDGTTVPLKLSDIRPRRTLSFRQSFDHLPFIVEGPWRGPMLVCTHPFKSVYGSRDAEEERGLEAKGYVNTMPYTYPQGDLKDFCGAISVAGDILYRFPVKPPTNEIVFAPVGAKEDGKVAIAFGKRINVFDGDSASAKSGNFYELLVWQKDVGLRRIALNPPITRIYDLRFKFFRDELR